MQGFPKLLRGESLNEELAFKVVRWGESTTRSYWGKTILSREKSKGTIPEVGLCLMCVKISEEGGSCLS